MNVALLLGLGCGVLIGVILVIAILKATKKDGSIKCKYDERQEVARGKGFKYGFFTLLIYEVCFAMVVSSITSMLNTTLLMLLSLLGCGIAIAVYVTYCIWHEAYISLNENKTRVLIAFIIIAVVNVAIGIVNISNVTGTDISMGWANIFCGILFFEIFIAMGIKKIADRRNEE